MTMPSDEVGKPGLFDRFAGWVDRTTSKAWFFAFSVAMVVLWAPSLPIVGDFDTWQLIINTPTTVLTFLLVAVQQNAGQRDAKASQTKFRGPEPNWLVRPPVPRRRRGHTPRRAGSTAR